MNVMSGMGTTVDRSSALIYSISLVSQQQVESAYRGSWLVKKIIDIPPLDMTRAWRDWQADKSDIEALEAEEKRLGLKAKAKRALILSRLYGGGALILGTGDADPSLPLAPDRIAKGGLAYVHVMSRYQLNTGPAILDIADPYFMKPEWFEFTSTAGRSVRLHPSRVIDFVGQKLPEGAIMPGQDWFWGDPILQSIEGAVKNADLATDGFASLIDQAKIDIIKIPDMMGIAGTPDGEARLLARLQAARAGQSMWRATLMDKEEEWEQRQITWTGIPEIMTSFLNVVAGAADIPVTRLLGQSPKGLQSTGDGEERDYHAMVKARQVELLAPALDRVDELLVRSALGKAPSDVYWEFAPLSQMSEAQAAEIEAKYATIFKTLGDTGDLPQSALSKIMQNRMIESGQYPGCEAAFEEAEAAGEELPGDEDPQSLLTKAEKTEQLRLTGRVTEDQAIALTTDARPRSLYVSRKLVNADELIRWAKGQGFETTLPAGDLHVTVLYSRAQVDWLKMGSAWQGDAKGNITIAPGGARIVEPLGDKGAVVLLFNGSELSWRHEEMVRNGASHDFDDYQPHVTITYAAPEGIDLAKVEPYRGKLVFGPEVFAEIDEDWTVGLVEDGGGSQAGVPFDDGNPYHRGKGPQGGQFTSGGESGQSLKNFAAMAKARPNYRHDKSIGLVEGNAPSHLIGFQRVINSQEVRKNLKRHGPGSKIPGQPPIGNADFDAIPAIVSTGTFRELGKANANKPQRIEYRATVGGKAYVYTEIVGVERQRLALISFYRKS